MFLVTAGADEPGASNAFRFGTKKSEALKGGSGNGESGWGYDHTGGVGNCKKVLVGERTWGMFRRWYERRMERG